MVLEVGDSSRAHEEAAAEEEASGAAAGQQQLTWVALASIPVVYAHDDAAAEAIVPGAADVVLELDNPRRAAYLALPERLAPEARSSKREDGQWPRIVATAPARLLVEAPQGRRGDTKFFFCNPRAGAARALPDVPRGFPYKLVSDGRIGVITGPGESRQYLVAYLHQTPRSSGTRHDSLLCFATATGKWCVKPLLSAPEHEPWGAHGVFAHGGFLWWVDTATGILYCDPFEEHPRLRLVALPRGHQMYGLSDGIRDARLLDKRRVVRPSQGLLRYVEIEGLSYDSATVDDPLLNPAVSIWTLIEPEGEDPWRPEYRTPFREIWANKSYVAAGLPHGKVPNLAVVDPNDFAVIYFLQGSSFFGWDAREARVVSSEYFWVDRVFQHSEMQNSAWITAWDLPPLDGDDHSSEGWGQGKASNEDEDLDRYTQVRIDGPNPLQHLCRPNEKNHKNDELPVASSLATERHKLEKDLRNVEDKIRRESRGYMVEKLRAECRFLKKSLAKLETIEDEK